MDLAGRTVLVTGATGFIGGRLVEVLQEPADVEVRALVRDLATASRLARFPVEIVIGDVTDPGAVRRAVQGCSIVFHCAPDPVARGRRSVQRAEGTKNVAEAALAGGVDRLVHVSSFAVYGPTPEGDLVERTPWAPTDQPYVRMKRAAEGHVRRLHQEHRLPAAIVQPTIVYGPYSELWTHRPLADLAGHLALPRGGLATCNAVYVDDVVDVLLRAAVRPGAVGATFLASASRPTTWRAFYGAYEAMLGRRAVRSVKEDEFLRLLKRDSQRHTVRHELRRLVGHPEVRASLKRLVPGLASTARAVRRRSRRGPRAAGHALPAPRGDGEAADRLDLPRHALPWMLLRDHVVRVDKASSILGFTPRFDLERGMALTARYADWAGLLPHPTDTYDVPGGDPMRQRLHR